MPDAGYGLQTTFAADARIGWQFGAAYGAGCSRSGFLDPLAERCGAQHARKKSKAQRAGQIELAVDSTGLKIFSEGEWLQNKHKTKAKRKSWRKLHLGLDITTGDIVCSYLTKDCVGDPTALPELLDQIDAPVSRFLADGAYAGNPTSDLLVDRLGEAIEIVIPPPITAGLSLDAACDPTPRDKHIAEVRDKGRPAWQVSSGYNHWSRGEALIGRWKIVIGPKLKARNFPNQKTDGLVTV
jgi:hypothetical protein